MKYKIAVLLTTYNRLAHTIECLNYLFNCELPDKYNLRVFIADSNSPDNTEKIIKGKFPDIDIFNVGDNVFWNQGMRLAWDRALKINPDFFLWLNDDTFLYKNALNTLIKDYQSLNKSSIVVGVTDYKGELTYGGRNKKYNNDLIKPNGIPEKVTYINGNCVLVSKKIYRKLGNLSHHYSHSLGDIDYGLRAIKNNIPLFCSSEVIGLCKRNDFKWYDSESFSKRYKNLKSPKGVPIYEYFYFNYKYFGISKGIKFIIASYTALFFPKIFKKVNNK